jgi:hypothetical protein
MRWKGLWHDEKETASSIEGAPSEKTIVQQKGETIEVRTTTTTNNAE